VEVKVLQAQLEPLAVKVQRERRALLVLMELLGLQEPLAVKAAQEPPELKAQLELLV
jgi:hypothetical protein